MSAAGPPLPRSIRLIRLPGLVCSLMSGVKRGYWHSSLLEAILAQQGEGRLGGVRGSATGCAGSTAPFSFTAM